MRERSIVVVAAWGQRGLGAEGVHGGRPEDTIYHALLGRIEHRLAVQHDPDVAGLGDVTAVARGPDAVYLARPVVPGQDGGPVGSSAKGVAEVAVLPTGIGAGDLLGLYPD